MDTQQLLQLTHQKNISFSQSSNSNETDEQLACRDIVSEKAVAYAVLAADDTEAILYPHLCFETELQDCISSPHNKYYIEKVYKLVTFGWKELITQITSKTVEIFQMQERTEWRGSDKYDAWLYPIICNGQHFHSESLIGFIHFGKRPGRI